MCETGQTDAVQRLVAGFNWLFRDRQTGQITVAQFPNLSLWLILAIMVLRRVMGPTGSIATTVDAVGAAALVWWSLDELFRGVNPWRRLLGIGGLIVAIGNVASLVR